MKHNKTMIDTNIMVRNIEKIDKSYWHSMKIKASENNKAMTFSDVNDSLDDLVTDLMNHGYNVEWTPMKFAMDGIINHAANGCQAIAEHLVNGFDSVTRKMFVDAGLIDSEGNVTVDVNSPEDAIRFIMGDEEISHDNIISKFPFARIDIYIDNLRKSLIEYCERDDYDKSPMYPFYPNLAIRDMAMGIDNDSIIDTLLSPNNKNNKKRENGFETGMYGNGSWLVHGHLKGQRVRTSLISTGNGKASFVAIRAMEDKKLKSNTEDFYYLTVDGGIPYFDLPENGINIRYEFKKGSTTYNVENFTHGVYTKIYGVTCVSDGTEFAYSMNQCLPKIFIPVRVIEENIGSNKKNSKGWECRNLLGNFTKINNGSNKTYEDDHIIFNIDSKKFKGKFSIDGTFLIFDKKKCESSNNRTPVSKRSTDFGCLELVLNGQTNAFEKKSDLKDLTLNGLKDKFLIIAEIKNIKDPKIIRELFTADRTKLLDSSLAKKVKREIIDTIMHNETILQKNMQAIEESRISTSEKVSSKDIIGNLNVALTIDDVSKIEKRKIEIKSLNGDPGKKIKPEVKPSIKPNLDQDPDAIPTIFKFDPFSLTDNEQLLNDGREIDCMKININSSRYVKIITDVNHEYWSLKKDELNSDPIQIDIQEHGHAKPVTNSKTFARIPSTDSNKRLYAHVTNYGDGEIRVHIGPGEEVNVDNFYKISIKNVTVKGDQEVIVWVKFFEGEKPKKKRPKPKDNIKEDTEDVENKAFPVIHYITEESQFDEEAFIDSHFTINDAIHMVKNGTNNDISDVYVNLLYPPYRDAINNLPQRKKDIADHAYKNLFPLSAIAQYVNLYKSMLENKENYPNLDDLLDRLIYAFRNTAQLYISDIWSKNAD